MLKLGICGTNNSHAVAFTQLLHQENDPVEGARVVAFYAYDEENVQRLNELGVTKQVENMTDLIPLIDAVLCVTRDGSKHLTEATPFLEAGIPTFVDKPLSTSLDDARKIANIADKHNTPLMSCSSVRYAEGIVDFMKRIDEVGEIKCGTVTGMGETIFYGVHTAEMMNAVFGAGVDFVVNFGPEGHDMGIAQYKDGKSVSIQIMRDAKVDFRVIVHGAEKREDIAAGGGYYREALIRMLEFFRTGKSPIPIEHTLEIMEVLTGLVKSREAGGERIYLRDL